MNKRLEKQINDLNNEELKLLNKKESKIVTEKLEPTVSKIQSKIPEKLMSTLESAFFQGFKIVFEKGHAYIDKTFDKEKLKLEYYLNDQALNKKINKRHLKRLDEQAAKSKRLNSAIAVVEGGVLGLLGLGLPDIPILISIIIKNIDEIAYSYGYDPQNENEKTYILLLICGAISKGEKQKKINEEVDITGEKIDEHRYVNTDFEQQIRMASNVLSEAMLMAKFIQGFAVIGAVGAFVNYSIIKKISEYASIKYKKRYLNKKTDAI